MKVKLTSASRYAWAVLISVVSFANIAVAQGPFGYSAGRVSSYRNSGASLSQPALGRPLTIPFMETQVSEAERGLFQQRTNEFIATNAAALGIGAANNVIALSSAERDLSSNTHARLHQTFNGIPVLGAEMMAHFNAAGELVSANLNLAPGLAIDTTPSISADAARNLAISIWQNELNTVQTPNVHSVSLSILVPGLLDRTNDQNASLVWEVSLSSRTPRSSENFYISANDGSLVRKLSQLRNLNRQIADCAAKPAELAPNCYMDLRIGSYTYGRSESAPVRGPYPPPAPTPCAYPLYCGSLDVDRMHALLGQNLTYWLNMFSRNGANGQSGTLLSSPPTTLSYVHSDKVFPVDCQSGLAWFNAGEGSFDMCRKIVTPDMVGHEYTHAVVFHSLTVPGPTGTPQPAGSIYLGETASLEESFADLNGVGLERAVLTGSATHTWNWEIGTANGVGAGNPTPAPTPQDPPYPSTGFGRIRNLSNPSAFLDSSYSPAIAYPARYASPDFYCGAQDNGGGHHNSTVPSFAMYLAANGGEYNGCTIQGIGLDAVLKIAYDAWTLLFLRTETFDQAYTDFISACASRYGSGSSECVNLTSALQAVGMNDAAHSSGGCPAGAEPREPDTAPACAVRNAGDLISGWPSTYPITTFAPGETVYLRNSGGIPGKTVNVYVLPHVERTAWSLIGGASLASPTLTSWGALDLGVMQASAGGTFDLLVDGNRDGYYQPWADSTATIEVRAPVDGDGICYKGESRATSENCMSAPVDCRCDPRLRCQDMACPYQPTAYECGPTWNGIPNRPRACLAE